MSRLRFCALGAMLIAASAFAQTTRQPLTHETLWMMKRVGTPAPSPDGKWVVFSLTEPSYDEKEQVSDLWIVPADGSSKPRRITASKAGESEVTWAPDSHRIAFSTKREGDEANQIYVLDLNGGEAQRVTSVSTGARSPQFRPDGKAIVFVSSIYPGAADDEANKKIAKERKDRKYNVRVYDSFPIRQWDRWLEERQPHLIVQDLEPGAKPRDILAGTSPVKEPGFAGRVAEGSREDIDAEWSPDGESIVFAATPGATRRLTPNTRTISTASMPTEASRKSSPTPRVTIRARGSAPMERRCSQFSTRTMARSTTSSGSCDSTGPRCPIANWSMTRPSIAPSAHTRSRPIAKRSI